MPEGDQKKPKVKALFPSSGAQPAKPQAEPTRPVVLSFGKKDDEGEVSKPPQPPAVVKPLFTLSQQQPAMANSPAASRHEASAGKPDILNLPGMTIRHRIAVSVEQLRALDPSIVSERALGSALDIVRVVNIDDPQSTALLDFGIDAQQRYAKLSEDILATTTAPVIDSVRADVARMTVLITETDLELLFKGHTGLRAILSSKPDFGEAKNVLLKRLGEIGVLSKTIQSHLSAFASLSQTTGVLHSSLGETLADVEALEIAAKFLVQYLRDHQSEKAHFNQWADALDRRVESLTLTRVTLLHSTKQLEMHEQSLRHFTEVVNNALVNLIPTWYGQCTGFLAGVRIEQSTDSVQKGDSWQRLVTLRSQILKSLQEKD